MTDILKCIHWLHHAGFRIECDGAIIYIDPWKLKTKKPADYIFITHTHFDHLSPADIDAVLKDNTLIICTENTAKQLKGYNIKKLNPGESFEAKGLKASAVPAYNIEKNFHKKEDKNAGYIIETPCGVIYHMGDTDAIPEIKKITGIDAALTPIGGTYTMNASEAAELINTIKPGIAIPMHYGDIIGGKSDAVKFKKAAAVKTAILDPEE